MSLLLINRVTRGIMIKPSLSITRVTSLIAKNSLFTSTRVFQNNTNSPINTRQKKKPLSRIPIGGSHESNSSANLKKPSTIEFTTWKAGALLIVVGSVLFYVFNKEKKRLQIEKEAESNRGYGKPLIGGAFNLIDFNGNPFTEKNLLGKFSILYFGFSHCPDICPEELDQLGNWLDELEKRGIKDIQPIFVTCDPARDGPEVLKEYLSEFHPGIIGLTGTYDEVKNACKKYRVYFSTPPNVKPGQDYLVDHSIFFYLMDPEGAFVDALGRQYDGITGANKIEEHIKTYVPKAEREKRKKSWYSFLF